MPAKRGIATTAPALSPRSRLATTPQPTSARLSRALMRASVLRRALSESEFLAPRGQRSLAANPRNCGKPLRTGRTRSARLATTAVASVVSMNYRDNSCDCGCEPHYAADDLGSRDHFVPSFGGRHLSWGHARGPRRTFNDHDRDLLARVAPRGLGHVMGSERDTGTESWLAVTSGVVRLSGPSV